MLQTLKKQMMINFFKGNIIIIIFNKHSCTTILLYHTLYKNNVKNLYAFVAQISQHLEGTNPSFAHIGSK